MINNQTRKNIDEEINFIYENESRFIRKFAPEGWLDNIIDISDISFSANKLKLVWVIGEGDNWVYDIPLDKYNDWRFKFDN